MPYAHLNDRAVLLLSGDDRVTFLQGLITNDTEKLAQGEALYAALLSPQGKFLHDFFLVPEGNHILIDIHHNRAADLMARLNIYKLRSKIMIAPQPDMHVTAAWEIPAPAQGEHVIADPRHPTLGWRIYGKAAAPTHDPHGDYEAHRIALGIPDGVKDMTVDKSLLLEFGFDALHGLSFSKGCYVGQEVTARSKFRGQVRKQLYRVESDAALPASGTSITTGSTVVGELRSTSGKQGLALLKTEEVEKAELPLMAGDTPLRCRLPEWNKPQ
mgnify:CR=1 FL=1